MRTIRIFVSSPGDVGEERSIAHRVIQRLQFRYAGRAKLDVLLWEHLPLLASAGFQDQIPNAADFDVVVMMLWSRLGTKLPETIQRPDGSRYLSGTEYEFEQALESSRARGLPSLLVYRKTARVMVELSNQETDLMELARQKKAVDQFIDHWFRSPDGSFHAALHSFESSAQFEDLLERHLRALIDKLLEGSDAGRPQKGIWEGSPFRGLERFDFEHGMIYFGRTAAINDVLTALRRQAAAGCPFVLVFGKSGVGKSSFLRAGVLPLLCDPGVIEGVRSWRRTIFEPSDSTGDLLDGLAASLLTSTALPELAEETTTEAELADLLRKSPAAVVPLVRRTLVQAAKSANLPVEVGQPPPARLCILVDPLEEIFSRPGATHEERVQFVDALEALARSGLVWVLGTMRSDFYERCSELPGLLALKTGTGQYHLAPPVSAEIGRMIRLPAQLAGLTFEEHDEYGKLDEVLKEAAAADPGALPLLQFALDEIYKRSNAEVTGLLTFTAYHELGGIDGAIRTRAEETFAEVAKVLGDRLDATYAAVFGSLVALNQVTEHSVVRLYARLDKITADADSRTLVEALINARLFMTDIDDEQHAVVTLAHEALLKHWPRLQHWIEENRDYLRIRSRATAAAGRWIEENREHAFLLTEGKPLAEAEHLLEGRRGDLSREVIEFIEASSAAVRAEHLQARRRTRRILATVSTALVIAVICAVVSLLSYLDAKEQRDVAQRQKKVADDQRIIAQRQRTIAEQQQDLAAGRAQAGQKLIQFLLDDLSKHLAPDQDRDAKIIQSIAQEVVRHYQQRKTDNDTPEVQRQYADDLLYVATTFRNMNHYSDASTLAELSLDLRTKSSDPSADKLVDTLDLLGVCKSQLGEYDASSDYYNRAVETCKQRFGMQHSKTSRALGRLAEYYRQQGHFAKSEAGHREALKIAEASQAAGDESKMSPAGLATRYNDLGELLRNRGKLEASAVEFQKAMEIAEQLVSRETDERTLRALRLQLAEIKGNFGVLRYDQGQLERALGLLNQALAIDIELLGKDKPAVAADRYKLARVLVAQNELEKAEEELKESWRVLEQQPNVVRKTKCWEVYADLRLAQKRYADASSYALQVLKEREGIFKDPWHPELIKVLDQLSRIERKAGHTKVADEYADRHQKMRDEFQKREQAAEKTVAVR